MLSLKDSLVVLKKTEALKEGHFILSSGLHSSKYVQCAKLLSFPNKAEKLCRSLASKIRKNFNKIDLILAPAMGGIIIGYQIGKILNIETIFCERVKGKFSLRRGFEIKPKSRVLIIEDVITTGKSSLECSKCLEDLGAKISGYACIIDRSGGNSQLGEIISQINFNIPVFSEEKLPEHLKQIKAIKPGSRKN